MKKLFKKIKKIYLVSILLLAVLSVTVLGVAELRVDGGLVALFRQITVTGDTIVNNITAANGSFNDKLTVTDGTKSFTIFAFSTGVNLSYPDEKMIFNADGGEFVFLDDSVVMLRMYMNRDFDQLVFGLDDEASNTFILSNADFAESNFDHAIQPDPTMFGHSDTSPDSDNTQWWGLTHDKTDARYRWGKGSLKFSSSSDSNNLEIKDDGDLNFNGEAGLTFGSLYGNNIDWTQVAVQDTWYNIVDSDIATGQLNNVTHDGNGKLTVTEPGRYEIIYSLSVESNTQDKHIESGIEINGSGSAEADGRQHIHLPNNAQSANTEWPMGAPCILNLADNATIEVSVRTTDTGTPTIMVDHINISVKQIGGN